MDDAIVSRAASGSINWKEPAPRSCIRGAVYTDSGDIVDDSERPGGTGSDLRVVTVNPRHLTGKERKEAADHVVRGPWLYAGSWMQQFGHFIVETLPNLWPLLRDEEAGAVRGLVAHRFTSRRRHPWQDAMVRPLIGEREIHVVDSTPATYERLMIPSRPYLYRTAISPRAAEVWKCVADRIAPEDASHPSRVFLSRTRFVDSLPKDAPGRARSYANSGAVDDLFRQRGFMVVYPEELTVADQVGLVRDAEIVAGAGGSALHLAAFMRSGRVIELGDKRSRTNLIATQRAIAAVKSQLIVHLPFHADFRGAFDVGSLDERLASIID
ncbi:glycosyltransferase family 61 protein [Promicromonospora panici]|uniref:glycosyltransferase family 61 protein n=1 Tax=Promicromonospora panici TaxID=2219658 RepID=UPI0013EC3754|nr:glycosyltransferase 61 family protein [Promicromonospora panici]